jgi:hypothetical protein
MNSYTRGPEDMPEASMIAGFTGLPKELSRSIEDHFSSGVDACNDPAFRFTINDAGDALYLRNGVDNDNSYRDLPLKPSHTACWFPGRGPHGFPLPIITNVFKDTLDRGIGVRFSTSLAGGQIGESIPITGKDMVPTGIGLLKAIQASRVTSHDDFRDVLQQRPCSTISGRESREMWNVIQPTAERLINIDMSGRPLPNTNQYRVWDVLDKCPEDAFPIHQFSLGRKLSNNVDQIVYHAKVEADELAGPNTWLRIIGLHALNAASSSVSYQLVMGQDLRKSQPISLNPQQRWAIYEAMNRDIHPLNLSLIHDAY